MGFSCQRALDPSAVLVVQSPNSRITVSVNPTSITPSGTSTLTVNVAANATPGVYSVRAVGTNAQLSAIGTLKLTVL